MIDAVPSPSATPRPPERMSWPAIAAGVAAGLVTQLLLNMLGVGIGVAALDSGVVEGMDAGAPAATTIGLVWWAVAGSLGAALGGITAGRLSDAGTVSTARWHGLVTWCANTLVVVALLGSVVGGILGGAYGALGGFARGASATAAPGAAGSGADPTADIVRQQVRQVIDPTGAAAIENSVGEYLKESLAGNRVAAQIAKGQAIDGLASSGHLPAADAQARLERIQAIVGQAVANSREQAATVARHKRQGVATAAILGFWALLLGAVAAWFGGGLGAGFRDRLHASPAPGP